MAIAHLEVEHRRRAQVREVALVARVERRVPPRRARQRAQAALVQPVALAVGREEADPRAVLAAAAAAALGLRAVRAGGARAQHALRGAREREAVGGASHLAERSLQHRWWWKGGGMGGWRRRGWLCMWRHGVVVQGW